MTPLEQEIVAGAITLTVLIGGFVFFFYIWDAHDWGGHIGGWLRRRTGRPSWRDEYIIERGRETQVRLAKLFHSAEREMFATAWRHHSSRNWRP